MKSPISNSIGHVAMYIFKPGGISFKMSLLQPILRERFETIRSRVFFMDKCFFVYCLTHGMLPLIMIKPGRVQESSPGWFWHH